MLSSLQKIQEICQADKYGCKQQIDIKAFSLDEITEAVASLVVFIKIYPVVLNHGIAHDYGEQQKTQCHYKIACSSFMKVSIIFSMVQR